MENWIGIAIWIVLGAVIGLGMKAVIKRPEATAGHDLVLAVLGAFAAVIGGMLGVGIFAFDDAAALSAGGMICAVLFAGLMAFIYRWGTRSMI